MISRLALLVCVWGGLLFVFMVATNSSSVPEYFSREAPRPTASDAEVITWLRARAAPGELVWRIKPEADGYAHYGGLPVPWTDNMTPRHGFTKATLAARSELLSAPPEQSAPYRRAGVRWFVYSTTDPRDKRLAMRCTRWVAAGEAVEATRVGDLRVIRLNGLLRAD